MPGIVISEASAKNHALFGELQAPLASFLEKRAEAIAEGSIVNKITREVKSTHRKEGYSGMTTMGDFLPTPENGAYPQTDFEVAYNKDIVNLTWKNRFSVSKEMMDDTDFKEIFKRAAGMMTDYERTREKFFFQILGTALKGETSFVANKIKVDCTAYDELPMFSKAHKGKISKKTICNAFSDAFSATALSRASTEMQNFTDENGNVLNLQPDTILIANDADLKEEVFAVIGSEKIPGSSNNDYNYLFQNWNVLVSPYLNQFLTAGAKPWVLLDSRMVQEQDVFIRQEREKLNVTSRIDDNDANTFSGRYRQGGGFVDFRGMAAGGLSFGSALG